MSDGNILDRLYTPEGAQLAANWLWENIRSLRENLPTAVPVASYVAAHAFKRFAGPAVEMTAADAEFLGSVTETALELGYDVPAEPRGGNGVLIGILMAIAKKLLEEWLSTQVRDVKNGYGARPSGVSEVVVTATNPQEVADAVSAAISQALAADLSGVEVGNTVETVMVNEVEVELEEAADDEEEELEDDED